MTGTRTTSELLKMAGSVIAQLDVPRIGLGDAEIDARQAAQGGETRVDYPQRLTPHSVAELGRAPDRLATQQRDDARALLRAHIDALRWPPGVEETPDVVAKVFGPGFDSRRLHQLIDFTEEGYGPVPGA